MRCRLRPLGLTNHTYIFIVSIICSETMNIYQAKNHLLMFESFGVETLLIAIECDGLITLRL